MYSGINASSNRRSVRKRTPKSHFIPVQPAGLENIEINLTRRERFVSYCRIFYHCLRRVLFGVSDGYDGDFEDFDVQVIHYKPSNLDDLCQLTHYSRDEIRLIYRGFKQECPAGIVDEERFRELYCQFFPLGDASPYAHFVFSTFDQDEDGHVTFDQFLIGMSLLARGTLEQKLQWVYNLYDITGTGKVSRANMKEILTAIHQMLGSHAQPLLDEQTINSQIDQIFTKLDLNADGMITFHEFMEACQNDPQMVSVLGKFDTVIS